MDPRSGMTGNRIVAVLSVALLAGAGLAIGPGIGDEQPVQSVPIPSDEGLMQSAAENVDTVREPSGQPFYFEPNEGQFHEEVAFMARAQGYTFFLTATEAVFVLSQPSNDPEAAPALPLAEELSGWVQPRAFTNEVIRMGFVDALDAPMITGVERASGTSNYFKGPDPQGWTTDVPHYGQVVVEDLWPGIDAVFYFTDQGTVRYDFVVHPGAQVTDIRLSFGDAQGSIEDGDLILEQGTTGVRMPTPFTYQGKLGDPEVVESAFVLRDEGEVGFQVADYDPSRPLVIDPEVQAQQFVYSTYFGGSSQDDALGVAADDDGNTYIVGETQSTNFPTANAYQNQNSGGDRDQFVTKLDASGALVYSTYLGGGGFDYAFSVGVDEEGRAVVAGYTDSAGFPTTPGAFQEARPGPWAGTVVKLSAQGDDLVFGTFLGGSGIDAIRRVALDDDGAVYVVGRTDSPDFPTKDAVMADYPGGQISGFVTKLHLDGAQIAFSTYLGGSGSQESATGIAVGGDKSAVVVGETTSADYPLVAPFQSELKGARDAVVTKFSPTGDTLVYSTYMGGSQVDGGISVTVDNDGYAYVVGSTRSSDFPVINPVQAALAGISDAFFMKIDPDGQALEYSSYLGGSAYQEGWGIGVDAHGNVTIAGFTQSSNFPTRMPLQANREGSGSAFVATIEAAGEVLLFSTYLGGNGEDFARDLTVDAQGDLHAVGYTQSTTFPTKEAFQEEQPGARSAFISKIARPVWFGPTVEFEHTPKTPTPIDDVKFIGQMKAGSGSIVSSVWDFGDGAISHDPVATHRFEEEGVHTVTLTVMDELGETDMFTKQVSVTGQLRMGHTDVLYRDVAAGQTAVLEGRLTNAGDQAREINLTASVDHAGWNVTTLGDNVTLAAGESMRVPVTVQVGETGGSAKIRLDATNESASDGFLVWYLSTPVFVEVKMNETTVGSQVTGTVRATFMDGTPATGLSVAGTRLNAADGPGLLASGFSGETDAEGHFAFAFDVFDVSAQLPGTHVIDVVVRLGDDVYRAHTVYQMQLPGLP